MMMHMRFHPLLLSACLISWTAGNANITNTSSSSGTNAKVTFLHVNDHNSHYFESTLDLTGSTLPPGLSSNVDALRIYHGGAARTIGLMRSLKSKAMAAGNDVIQTHGGDATGGTVFFSFFGSDIDSAILNSADFDVMVLGDHELDNGDSFAASFLRKLNISVLAYNLIPHNGSDFLDLPKERQLQKFKIRQLSDGTKLGICGILDKTIIEDQARLDAGTKVLPDLESTQACVAEMEALGINKIAILSHLGYQMDIELLAPIKGVDVILGSHSHTLMGNDADYSKIGLKPSASFGKLINGTCIVHAWEFFKALGELVVEFDSVGNVVSCGGQTYLPLNTAKYIIVSDKGIEKANLSSTDAQTVTNHLLSLPMFASADEDPGIASIIASYNSRLNSISSQTIASVPQNLCITQPGPVVDTEAKQMCPDIDLLKIGGAGCLLAAHGFLYVTRTADIGFQNLGGCKAPILSGDLTYGEIFQFLPWNDLLVTLALTGDQVRRTIEDGFNYFLNYTLSGDANTAAQAFPLAAGLRWDVDCTKPFGKRITNIQVNRRLSSTWETLNPTSRYVIVTNDFLALPRDGYFTLGEVNKNDVTKYVNTYSQYAQSFIDYAKFTRVIKAPPYDQWSTQYMVLTDGSVVNIREKAQQQQQNKTGKGSSDATASATTQKWLWIALLIHIIYLN